MTIHDFDMARFFAGDIVDGRSYADEAAELVDAMLDSAREGRWISVA